MNKTAIERRPPVTTMARRFAFPTQTAFLSQAVLLEEAGPPRAPALVCLLGFTFVAIALVAGMLIEIDVITSSPGRITAADGNHVLQSFDGGIVDRVEVEEGQIVETGDLLLTLKDPEGQAQLERLVLREAALFAQVRRLQALVTLPSTASIQQPDAARAVIDEQMSILRLERDALATEQSLVQAEIDRRVKALHTSRALEKDATLRLSLIWEQLRTDRQLHAKGLLPKAQLLEAEQQAIDATFELTEVQGQTREAEASLSESNRRLDNAIASKKQRQGDRLSSILIDLNETRQQIEATRRRLARAEIKAPARGVVMELVARHPGQTIAPGGPIVEVIPIDGGLVAETRLPPSEISHVHPGQPVRVAIDGIEPHRHGYLEGDVAAISPSTFVDENMLPYYRTTIRLASDRLNAIPLTSGMTIQAQIKTGQRTVLEYLLKPVYRAWSTAFHER
ncbi:MAG: HlyD family type I secretion periplasmic adaptor subunit [Geminicoccaceae bacterium]